MDAKEILGELVGLVVTGILFGCVAIAWTIKACTEFLVGKEDEE
jgi:hypothetical protein